MTLALIPGDELVATSWVASIPGLSPQMVATQLPADETAWSDNGFVTVAVVGGTPHPDLPLSRPVIQCDCWAVSPSSSKPPWFKANAIATAIKYACWHRTNIPRLLTITANGVTYPTAAVRSAVMVTQPRRIYGDPANAARYSCDISLVWAMTNDRLD